MGVIITIKQDVIFDIRASQRYHYRLMSNCMLGLVDPYKLAKATRTFHGELAVASMNRLVSQLVSGDGCLEYELAFYIDEHGLNVVAGKICGTFVVKCQRCLRACMCPLDVTFLVSPVITVKDSRELPDEYDPVLLVDGKIDLLELVEEELILAMPIVVMHEPGDIECVKNVLIEEPISVVGNNLEQENPFAVLQTLQKK